MAYYANSSKSYIGLTFQEILLFFSHNSILMINFNMKCDRESQKKYSNSLLVSVLTAKCFWD